MSSIEKQTLSQLEKPIDDDRSDKYTVLGEAHRMDGSYKSVNELEMEYIDLTDALIHKMTHGVEVGGGEVMVPTKVIFLDKSARPLAWLTRDLWDTLAPEPGSDEIPKRPDFKFLNIHRDPWKDIMDPNNLNTYTPGSTNHFDAKYISKDIVQGLRAVYDKETGGSYDTHNEMDGERVLVVDEVRGSGATLGVALELLRTAFPDSQFVGTHWMSSTTPSGHHLDQPLWYRNDETDSKMTPGRGVDNRRPNPADPASHFLSTRFHEPDQRANRLREDFKLLAQSLKDGEVLYAPLARARETEDAEARIEAINGLPMRQALMARRAIQQLDAEQTRREEASDRALERKLLRDRKKANASINF